MCVDAGLSEGKMKCYSLVDGRRPWPPMGVFGGGSRVLPRIFFTKLEAKPLLLGTFQSVPSSTKTSFPAGLQIISAL